MAAPAITTANKPFRPLIRLSILLLSLLYLPATQAMDIDELMIHIDRLWRGDTSQATMSMTVKTRRY